MALEHIQEHHRHRYEFNNAYKAEYEAAGMQCTGINPESDLVESRDTRPEMVCRNPVPPRIQQYGIAPASAIL